MTRSLHFLFLVVFCATEILAQQNPDGKLPIGTTDQPYLFLVRDAVVHADLGLTPVQQKAVNELNDETDAAMWSMRNKPNQIVDIMKKTTQTTQQRLAKILRPDQVKRLAQIEGWVLGVKSLLHEPITGQLNLTSDQTTEIRDVIASTAKEVAALHEQLQNGGDPAELNKQHRAAKTQEQQTIYALLDKEQQQKWIALLGKRVDLDKLGHVKFKAPQLQGSGWVNSEPLTMEKLKGKVVALHFYAFA